MIKTVRDLEILSQKKKKKGKDEDFNPNEPKDLKLFIATRFPEWQDIAVDALRQNYDEVGEPVRRVTVVVCFNFDLMISSNVRLSDCKDFQRCKCARDTRRTRNLEEQKDNAVRDGLQKTGRAVRIECF
jgi:hypothetical protein